MTIIKQINRRVVYEGTANERTAVDFMLDDGRIGQVQVDPRAPDAVVLNEIRDWAGQRPILRDALEGTTL